MCISPRVHEWEGVLRWSNIDAAIVPARNR